MAASQSTILVVEDEPLIRLILIETLQDEGYRVLAASNVLEAIGHIARHAEIDGLVTDVDLPGGLSGLDLLKLFSNCRPDAARIVVSGRGDLREATLPATCRHHPPGGCDDERDRRTRQSDQGKRRRPACPERAFVASRRGGRQLAAPAQHHFSYIPLNF